MPRKSVAHVQPLGHWTRVFVMASCIGLAAGLAAAAMEWGLYWGTELLIGRYVDPTLPQIGYFRWPVLLLPAFGGLLAGGLVGWLLAGETRHGTEALTHAFHWGQGVLPWRAPAIRAAAAVGVIACGGSAGPEGPMAALGASLGSALGRYFQVTPQERRILLIAGCAAGIGAIFRCPLGGALFAVSILYSEPDYESGAIVPSVIASVIGYSAFMACWGYGQHLLHGADRFVFTSPLELAVYALLGPLCGVVSLFFTRTYRFVEGLLAVHRYLPRWATAGLGGLATGALACLLPLVMDGQYRFIQAVMEGRFFAVVGHGWWWWTGFLALATLLKCLATSFTIGSGAPGGVLGPSLFIGGIVGAFLGALLEALLPGMFPESLRQALIPVGMAGVLAAGMRIPLAAVVMVMEMTGSYGLIAPLMLVCVSAYVVGRGWGLNREQLPTSAQSPAHAADTILHLLESSRVRDLFEPHWPWTVTPATPLAELICRIQPGQPPTFAVVQEGHLVGLIALSELDRTLADPALGQAVIADDLLSEPMTTLFPDEDLYVALELFGHSQLDALPVVARDDPTRWLGMLARRRVFEAVQTQIDTLRQMILKEHKGLATIDEEAGLGHLVMSLAPSRRPRVRRLMVPVAAVGKSLRQCDFRRCYGVQVFAVERAGGRMQCPPDLDCLLQASDRLLVLDLPATPPPSDSSAAEPSAGQG